MKTRPRGRETFAQARAVRRLRSPDARFTRSLRRAVRASEAGEVIVVHAIECSMGDDCTCVPVTLIVGPKA